MLIMETQVSKLGRAAFLCGTPQVSISSSHDGDWLPPFGTFFQRYYFLEAFMPRTALVFSDSGRLFLYFLGVLP
jgi:hypothetical protein